MAESRIVATERLRKEGRWDEASAYRDEVRRKLKAEKKPRAEANDAAWAAMIEKYPPLPVADPFELENGMEDEAADFNALLDRVKDNPPDVDRDALWVYEHLDVRGVVPDDAPSMGAWSLLKWGRENRDRFFEQMLPKANASTQKRKGPGGTDGAGRDDEIVDDDLEELREWMRGYDIRRAEGFISDMPAAVVACTQKMLDNLKHRNKLDLSPEQTTLLFGGLLDVVQACVEAALARTRKNTSETTRSFVKRFVVDGSDGFRPHTTPDVRLGQVKIKVELPRESPRAAKAAVH